MQVRARIRSGVTLIDLIVVLGFLLFLLAMAAPFLFRLRGQSAVTMSQNNLRQIVLATHDYEHHTGVLPPIAGKGLGVKGSIFFQLLPFLEQSTLYDKGPVWEADTIGERLPFLIHPGDKTAPPGNKFEGWLATTNYAGNWMVFGSGKLTLHTINDGTSNTIFYAERYQVCGGHPCGWGYDGLYYWAPMFAYYSSEKFQHMPQADECNPALAQSLSAQGINLAMGDGRVLTISPAVSRTTWHAALTPNGNDIVGADFE